jgi:hypothetical protein
MCLAADLPRICNQQTNKGTHVRLFVGSMDPIRANLEQGRLLLIEGNET